MTFSDDSSPRRVLAFTGTRHQFVEWLRGLHLVPADLWVSGDPLDELFEWELTASIARHPAGKGLGPIDGLHDSNADGFWSERGFCCALASDFNTAGARHSADCVRSGE